MPRRQAMPGWPYAASPAAWQAVVRSNRGLLLSAPKSQKATGVSQWLFSLSRHGQWPQPCGGEAVAGLRPGTGRLCAVCRGQSSALRTRSSSSTAAALAVMERWAAVDLLMLRLVVSEL